MSFSWPWALTALLVIPLLAATWWWWRRRRRRVAVRVSSIALVRAAAPGRSSWRRRVPVALLVLGLIVLGIGAARPRASVPVASTSTTIMLALDVSGSMCSTDVLPNRITAAERAAAEFIKSQGGGPRVGLVTFAGTAVVLVPPTTDTSKLLSALSGLSTSFGTAIGQGILTSLDAIAQVDHSVAPTGARLPANRGVAGYSADAVVLLTDGANTQGVDPQIAAHAAADRGVRVYTIGFGTNNPASLACDTSQFGGFGSGGFSYGGPGGPGGAGSPLSADDNALKQIARTTGGGFYRAQNAGELQHAFRNLPARITVVRQFRDIADVYAGAGGLIVAAAVALSLWWSRPARNRNRPARNRRNSMPVTG
jgi:Ca-activated chloride channel family protein